MVFVIFFFFWKKNPFFDLEMRKNEKYLPVDIYFTIWGKNQTKSHPKTKKNINSISQINTELNKY